MKENRWRDRIRSYNAKSLARLLPCFRFVPSDLCLYLSLKEANKIAREEEMQRAIGILARNSARKAIGL